MSEQRLDPRRLLRPRSRELARPRPRTHRRQGRACLGVDRPRHADLGRGRQGEAQRWRRLLAGRQPVGRPAAIAASGAQHRERGMDRRRARALGRRGGRGRSSGIGLGRGPLLPVGDDALLQPRVTTAPYGGGGRGSSTAVPLSVGETRRIEAGHAVPRAQRGGAAIATMGALRRLPAKDPKKGTPRLTMPPSARTSQ